MSDAFLAVCPSCGGHVSDGLMCSHCAGKIVRNLRALAELVPDLEVTLTRQGQTGTGNGGRGAETPLPYDHRAAKLHRDATGSVASMVAEVGRYGDAGGAPQDLAGRCLWLADRAERLRGLLLAEWFADRISSYVKQARYIIDLPPERRFVGYCPVCGAGLYADQDQIDTICGQCARVLGRDKVPGYNVEQSRTDMLNDAAARLVTLNEAISAVAALWDMQVNAKTVRTWRDRGRFVQRGSAGGVPLYRLGDVLDLARMHAASRQASA